MLDDLLGTNVRKSDPITVREVNGSQIYSWERAYNPPIRSKFDLRRCISSRKGDQKDIRTSSLVVDYHDGNVFCHDWVYGDA